MGKIKADIVLPDGNEESFIAIAKKLGYTHLIFAYQFDQKKIDSYYSRFCSLQADSMELVFAIISDAKNIDQAKKHSKTIITMATGNDRACLEGPHIKAMFGFECIERKDSLHSRKSGLNQVLCKICHDKGKIVALSFGDALKAESWSAAIILGRMSQNIRLCRKYKVKMAIASFASNPFEMRAAHDLLAWGIALGMHPSEAKDSLSCLVQ